MREPSPLTALLSAALEFLETRVASKIPEKGTAPCDPTRLNPYLLRPEHKKRPS